MIALSMIALTPTEEIQNDKQQCSILFNGNDIFSSNIAIATMIDDDEEVREE